MKWLIYFLVVVNVAFFLWQYRRADATMPTPAIAHTTSQPRLLLRREADDSSLLPRGAPAAGQAGSNVRPPGDERPRSGEQPGELEAEQRPAARAVADTGDRPTETAAAAPPARPVSTAARGGGATQTCFAMGPFSADQSVEDLLIWLSGKGGRATSRWSEQETPSRYWVYLPPLETIEQARAVLRRLKDDGLQDYIRVMRGPMRNAISLGLFKQRDSADRRLAELRAMGYDPELDIRYKSERVRWLDVAFSQGERFPEATFRAEFPAVGWSPAHCPVAGPIAGAPGIP